MISALLLSLAVQSMKITEPTEVSIVAVDADRAFEEFEAVCLEPMFDPERTREAVANSSFDYEAEDTSEYPHQYRWQEKHAILSMTLAEQPQMTGLGVPQCSLGMGSKQPLSQAERAERLEAVLKRTIGGKVTSTEEGIFRWPADIDGYYHEIDMRLPPGEVHQDLTFLLTTFSPEKREYIERMIAEHKKRAE